MLYLGEFPIWLSAIWPFFNRNVGVGVLICPDTMQQSLMGRI